ncbi:radical SAM family heme chaperone HemW [Hornefia butyriciproducens]|uniref:radical SAM family heme chaperone HemW n=1 Tax=Hornefia butyriciproducens TaxID=2652293 RepID=UPI003F8886C2
MTTNNETDNGKKALGIYIHIPFCRSRCRYCGFYSRAAEDSLDSGKAMEQYIWKLIGEIAEKGAMYRRQYVADSVFIGGGTPSMMPAAGVEAVLGAVREHFVLSSDAEVTLEANPDTVDLRNLRRWRAAGVNRLSMGVQSLDDGILHTLGRIHSAGDAVEAYRLARKAGFRNINLDLMFAVPGQSMEQWMNTVNRVIGLDPEHISFYSLQIEEDTPFYEAYMNGELDFVPEETDRAMYHAAIAAMRRSGYEHYEISNMAKPGMRCRHNLKYWSFGEYLGIGDSASSFMNGVRWTEKPREEYHENDFADNTGEYVFTGLRKTEGIRKSDFARRFGREFWEVYGSRRGYLEEYFEEGLLLEEGDVIRLSERGIDISNSIMAIFV